MKVKYWKSETMSPIKDDKSTKPDDGFDELTVDSRLGQLIFGVDDEREFDSRTSHFMSESDGVFDELTFNYRPFMSDSDVSGEFTFESGTFEDLIDWKAWEPSSGVDRERESQRNQPDETAIVGNSCSSDTDEPEPHAPDMIGVTLSVIAIIDAPNPSISSSHEEGSARSQLIQKSQNTVESATKIANTDQTKDAIAPCAMTQRAVNCGKRKREERSHWIPTRISGRLKQWRIVPLDIIILPAEECYKRSKHPAKRARKPYTK
jgi:hypothetical protein